MKRTILCCLVFLFAHRVAFAYDFPDIPMTDVDRIAWEQDLSSASQLNLIADGWSTTNTSGRQITFTSTNDNSAVTFTIFGTVAGTYDSEEVTGPDSNTVSGQKYFDKVERIETDGAIDDVSVGIGGAKIEIDTTDGTSQQVELNSDTELTLANIPTGEPNALEVTLESPADYEVTLPTATWESSAPTFQIGYDYTISFWNDTSEDLNASYTSTESFDWYVDSVNGSDSNTGTSPDEAFATISKLMEQSFSAGDKIGLATGSHWREKLVVNSVNVTVQSYGTGSMPLLDASDVITDTWTQDPTYTNCWYVDITPAIADSKTWINVFADDAFLRNYTTLTNLNSNDRGYYVNKHVGSGVVRLHINPVDDENPNTNQTIYEFTSRTKAIEFNSSGGKLKGVIARRNLHEDGSGTFGPSTQIVNCEFNDGSKHNLLYNDGAVLKNVTAREMYYAGLSAVAFIYNENSPAGLGITHQNCRVENDQGATGVMAFSGHKNVSGNFGTVIFDGCYAEGVAAGFGGVDSTSYVANGCAIKNCSTAFQFSDDGTNYEINNYDLDPDKVGSGLGVLVNILDGISLSVDRMNVSIPATTSFYGLFKSQTSNLASLNVKNSSFDFTSSSSRYLRVVFGANSVATNSIDLTSTHNIFNNSYSYYLTGTDSVVSSEYNSFVNSENFNIAGIAYASFSAYQTATSQDADSVVGDAIAPTVTEVSSTTDNGNYGVGDQISIIVGFSEVVNVNTDDGTPTLWLETGTTDRQAVYASGSGTDTLTFTYTVQAGDSSSDLAYRSTEALFTNKALIRDNANNVADLTMPTPGATDSLSANRNIVIDTGAPTISSPGPSGNLSAGTTSTDLVVTTSENTTCKYSTSSQSYSQMTSTFTVTGGTSHSTTLEGLANNTSYTYYVRCQDPTENVSDETVVSFRILSSSEALEKPQFQMKKDLIKLGSKKIYLDKKNLKLKGTLTELIGGRVEIYADGKKVGQATVQGDGSWSKKLDFGSNQSYDLKIKYFDVNDNEIGTQNYRFEIDNEKPVFVDKVSLLTELSNDQAINFSAIDQDTKISYYRIKLLDDKGHIERKWRKQKESYYYLPKDVSTGIYTLIVRAYDKAENYVEQKTILTVSENSSGSKVLGIKKEKEGIDTKLEQEIEPVIDNEVQEEPTPKEVMKEDNGGTTKATTEEIEQPKKDNFKWWNPFSWF